MKHIALTLLMTTASGKKSMRLDGYRNDWAPAFSSSEGVDTNELHETVFAVKQSNDKVLLETLYSVSDPQSPDYGKHLTFEQMGKLVRSDASTQKVSRISVRKVLPLLA